MVEGSDGGIAQREQKGVAGLVEAGDLGIPVHLGDGAMHLCMFRGYRMLLANNAPFYVAHDSRGFLHFLSSSSSSSAVVSFFKNTVATSSLPPPLSPPPPSLPWKEMLEPIEQEVGEGVVAIRWRVSSSMTRTTMDKRCPARGTFAEECSWCSKWRKVLELFYNEIPVS